MHFLITHELCDRLADFTFPFSMYIIGHGVKVQLNM